MCSGGGHLIIQTGEEYLDSLLQFTRCDHWVVVACRCCGPDSTLCNNPHNAIHQGPLLLAEITLQWRHNEPVCVSNHQPHDCLLNRLFRRRSKETSKRRVTGLCARNSPGTGEFPAQRASNAENVSIWWRHHELIQHSNHGMDKLLHPHKNMGCNYSTMS